MALPWSNRLLLRFEKFQQLMCCFIIIGMIALCFFHKVDREGQTALHIAVDASAKKTAQFLLFKGAEVNAVRMNMATPLHLAATAGDVETVEMLLNFKANVEAKNINHETPLHKAALFNNVPVIDLLLNR